MREVIIYTLSDKINVRYIGKTFNPKKRLNGHLSDAKTRAGKSYRNNWINSLLSKGEKPIIEVLDIVSENDWIFWEKYWISQFKTWGFSLVNLSEGGENPPSFEGKTHSKEYKLWLKHKMSSEKNPAKNGIGKEWRTNISNALKNKPLSKNHRDSLGIKILQVSLKNDIIATWSTISEASRSLNISLNGIAMCVRGERKTCGGYKWIRYGNDK